MLVTWECRCVDPSNTLLGFWAGEKKTLHNYFQCACFT